MPDFLGPTYDDVRAQQRAVQALLVSLGARSPAAAVPARAADWDVLSKQALSFASEKVTVNPFALGDQFERGKVLLVQLNEWDRVLSGRQPAESPPQGQPRAPYIPYVAPGEVAPGAKTFWQQATDNLTGDAVLLLLLAYALSKHRG